MASPRKFGVGIKRFIVSFSCTIIACGPSYAWEKNKCPDIKDAYYNFENPIKVNPYMSLRAWVIPSPLPDRIDYEKTLSNLVKKPPKSLPSLDCHWQQIIHHVSEYGYTVNCVNPKTGRNISQTMQARGSGNGVPTAPSEIPSQDDKDIVIDAETYLYPRREIAICLKKRFVRYALNRIYLNDHSLGYLKERVMPALLFWRIESKIDYKVLDTPRF